MRCSRLILELEMMRASDVILIFLLHFHARCLSEPLLLLRRRRYRDHKRRPRARMRSQEVARS